MTLPALIQNYQEKVVVNKVSKFYSEFSQAYQLAVNDLGTMDNWGLSDTIKVKDENDQYVLSEEGLKSTEKFFDIMDKYLKRVSRTEKTIEYSKSTGNDYILSDGMSIASIHILPISYCRPWNKNSTCADIYLKTDTKEPMYRADGSHNKNVFNFRLHPHSVTPTGFMDSEFDKCKSGENYATCTAWVLHNKNMDYLKCPEKLSWKGKHSCK